MEPQFPHVLYTNNTHHTSTGSLRAKGKTPGLRAPFIQVQGINPLVMGCISTGLWSNSTRCWTNNS